jgi:chromosome partitioning protein
VEFDVLYEIWDAIARLLDNPIVRVVSYVVSPILAILAFLWNRKDRREIIDKSTELGRLENEVENAHASIREKQHDLQIAGAELERRDAAIKKLEDDLRRITEGSQQLWKLRDGVRAFPEYSLWLRDPSGAKILTVANLKGGVGKTTLAANLAAYVSAKFGKSVLVLDLDYQGSLSNMLMLAAGKELVDSSIDQLLGPSEEEALVRLSRARVQLDPRLPRVWLVPASYTLAQVENRLLLNWLLDTGEGTDVRYRLARVLLDPNVRREYKIIILDTPPRMTLGTINALVASHFFVVPTGLDRLSAEAVPQFITNMKAIKSDLKLDIDLAGIAGMMSRVAELNDGERLALHRAREGGMLWDDETDFVLTQTIPRRAAIADAAGGDVAYFENPIAELFDPLFAQICENMRLD